MNSNTILQEIRQNLAAVIARSAPRGQFLWASFIQLHPADIADFLTDIDRESRQQLFQALPQDVRREVFEELSDAMKVHCLAFMTDHEAADTLHGISPDELTDLFDHFSDEELKKYLSLLHQHVRLEVLSLLQFDPESAGGIMTTDVVTLIDDFTVEKSISILQRLRPSRDIHQQIFVIDHTHRLVGHINLEDLVMQKPKSRIASFMHMNELVVLTTDDREKVAHEMVHYGLMIAPVVDTHNYFLGVISSETLVDVIVQEASEDVQKMAALTPMKESYFEIPLMRLFYQRGYILAVLLVVESFSSTILHSYEATLSVLLTLFIPMLISVGGNASNQTSAMVIQGMAVGDIGLGDMFRFLRREIVVSALLAFLLALVGFIRVYLTSHAIWEGVAISVSLALIVFCASVLGSSMPFLLKRLRIDPAFAAGPFLATIMDILGIFLYCYICKLILF
jgi:magnesium transporter